MTASDCLVLARCAGFAFRAPGLGHPNVPPPLRAGFAAALAYALAPGVRASACCSDGMPFVCAVAAETLIGAAVGTAASALYDAAYAGGRAVDDYVGIRGSIPSAGLYPNAAFGRLWSSTYTAAFLMLGAYRPVILALSDGFGTLPPGSLVDVQRLQSFALAFPVTFAQMACAVALPAIALSFLTQIALGAIARVLPRFATFMLSFPIVFSMALLATLVALPGAYEAAVRPWLYLPFLNAHGR